MLIYGRISGMSGFARRQDSSGLFISLHPLHIIQAWLSCHIRVCLCMHVRVRVKNAHCFSKKQHLNGGCTNHPSLALIFTRSESQLWLQFEASEKRKRRRRMHITALWLANMLTLAPARTGQEESTDTPFRSKKASSSNELNSNSNNPFVFVFDSHR